ncbi:MAG TPA: hypothetical protein VFM68_03085 [Candidatus Saccharimonadales bacterium]|nr:hypothetical protein [Candidatus Saccharimonadales bacterium]
MNIQPQAQQAISDDQELAKVLAGINQQADEAADTTATTEEPKEATASTEAPAEISLPDAVPPVAPEVPAVPAAPATPAAPVNSELDAIKKDALSELRPLVDKLDVSPEEKFDTYLLLLRSTDDQSLIGPAFAAARSIADEARRAQALLDIIKEIDYLSGAQQAA